MRGTRNAIETTVLKNVDDPAVFELAQHQEPTVEGVFDIAEDVPVLLQRQLLAVVLYQRRQFQGLLARVVPIAEQHQDQGRSAKDLAEAGTDTLPQGRRAGDGRGRAPAVQQTCAQGIPRRHPGAWKKE